jgi:TolB-like protein
VILTVALALLSAAAPAEKSKLAVTALTAAGEVDPAIAQAITELVTAEVSARGFFEPISSAEITTMLGAERQRQLLGCNGEEGSCITELAGALGAGFVMTGSLAKVGGVFQLNLQVIDTRNAHPLGRGSKLARDFESLRMLVPYAVAEACGTPLPPPPSRVLPYSMIGVGAAAVIGGGVLGIIGLNNESVIHGELAADDDPMNPTVIGKAKDYRDRLSFAGTEKTISLVALIAGTALIAGGIFLIPPDMPQPGQRVALIPTGNGVALVGIFP